MNITGSYDLFYKSAEALSGIEGKATLAEEKADIIDADNSKVMEQTPKENISPVMNENSSWYGNPVSVKFSEEGLAALSESQKEQPQTCTTNTDAVDQEIEKLKEERQQLLQQIQSARGDEKKIKELEHRLAQIENELSQKDNDTYRRQNAVIKNI